MKKTYHLCWSGGEDILFRDEEDYIRGFNCFALALYKTGSTGLVEAFMSNHVHLIVQSEQPKDLMYLFRLSYAKFFNYKHQRSGAIGEKIHFQIDVVGLHHHLAALSYVLRNPLHHGVVPIPYAYPHSSANVIFQAEMGKSPDEELLSPTSAYRYLGRRTAMPHGYKMNKSGLILRESVLDVVQVENLYGTPRTFNYYMSRKSGEEWRSEQNKDRNDIEPVTLENIEKGINLQPLDKMLAYESGRSDYRRITDIQLCAEIDSQILPSYGKVSVYHLTDAEKNEVANNIAHTHHLPFEQIRRCLAL